MAIATLAAGGAQAGTPMNVLERKAAAEAMARQYAAQQQAAQGEATTPSANSASEVPDDLHNYLHARVDANGKVRILETDGKTPPPKQEANHE